MKNSLFKISILLISLLVNSHSALAADFIDCGVGVWHQEAAQYWR